MINTRTSIRLFNGQLTRSQTWVCEGNISAVHFFYIGGILPLPYQFYHHAHKMLCDHGQIFFFFLFDTDHHRATTPNGSDGYLLL